ncbi:hypothetical protein AVEN_184384-1 [Araneus ventricosus]|uniref:Uncharacterized protein n=1 Tax=Araneus ventricosus TaxID=182803 RepID=A0A4Y2BGW5_ARAVE|nr:hypothetical protein AVEN_184384-1 [Araneus ventricosus]
MNDGRYDVNAETKFGVLMTINGLGPTAPAGSTSLPRSRSNSIPQHYFFYLKPTPIRPTRKGVRPGAGRCGNIKETQIRQYDTTDTKTSQTQHRTLQTLRKKMGNSKNKISKLKHTQK